MQLKDFIRETLTEIITATVESQQYLREQSINAEISPKVGTQWEKSNIIFSDSGKPIQNVEFDIAVTVADKKGAKGSLGLAISVLKLGGEVNSEKNNQNVSKIKFSIPITLPF